MRPNVNVWKVLKARRQEPGWRARLRMAGSTLAIVALLAPLPGVANDWTGAVNSDWFNGANWSTGVAPTPSAPDDVAINAGMGNPAHVGANAVEAQANFVAVGQLANGALIVDGGGRLTTLTDAGLGILAGVDGRAMLSGAGSGWGVLGDLGLGVSGTGTLQIENGATFYLGGEAIVGIGADALGTILVDGVGSTFVMNPGGTDSAWFGWDGQADLTIRDGGAMLTHTTILGFNAGSEATVSVSSADPANLSTWETGEIAVGLNGTAQMDIGPGGQVTTLGNAFVGGAAGGRGNVTVTGAAGTAAAGWNVDGLLAVGFLGDGSLTVGDRGFVDVATGMGLGYNAGTVGDVTISGGLLRTGNNVTLGGLAGTGFLIVGDMGVLSVGLGSGSVQVGPFAGSTGHIYIGAPMSSAMPGTIVAASIDFGAGDGGLTFNHIATDYVFEPDLVSDPAGTSFIEHWAGQTTYSGDGSGFFGPTEIAGGRFDVTGVLGGSVTVDGVGATLGGTGSVGAVSVLAGGRLVPGNALGSATIGTLTASDVDFATGATFEIGIDAGGNDLLHATGSATLAGGTVGLSAGSAFAFGTPYTILTADGGVSGSFDGTDIAGSLFVTPTLGYDANNVYLSFLRTADLVSVASTPNQIAAATGAQSVGAGSLYSALLLLDDAAVARAAFDSISGEIHASAKTVLLEDSRFVREAALARLGDTPAGGTGFWAQGYGSWGDWESDGNAAALSRANGGLMIGGDMVVGEALRLGLLAGYGRASLDVAGRSSTASAESYTLGAYLGGRWGGLSLGGGVAQSWTGLETSRDVVFPGYSDALSASYDTRALQAWAEAAYRVDLGAAAIEPYANIAHVRLTSDGFAESGGAAALTAGSQSATATFATLGLRGEMALDFGTTATLSGGIGWRHAFASTPQALQSFAAGGDAFAIAGVPLGQDALVLDAGIDIPVATGASLGLSYNGQIGSGLRDHGLTARFSMTF